MMRKTVMALLAGVALGVMAPQIVATTTAQENTPRNTYEYLDLFGDIFERVRVAYVEEVDEQKLIEAAIDGMLASLDPHSAYLPPKNFQDMREQTKGEFGGLGIEVTMENGLVRVVSPIDDTPAFRAGIQAGDLVTHLDGEQVMGLTLSEAVDRMRGPVGADIVLTIRRESEPEPFDVTITRDIIRIQSVRWRIEDDAAYIRITSFNEQTESGVKKAFKMIREERGETITGVVLDLRNNPGGLLDQAVAVSDLFLDKGEIVSTRGRRADSIQRFNSVAGDLADGLPVIVLINGGSASASEIVAGALQDHYRAVVLGTQSFGKGSVQTIIPLSGHGAIRLTTARYYTPSGRSIQAKGIVPDIVVEAARIEAIEQSDRTEAGLRNRLASEDELNGDEPPDEGEEAETATRSEQTLLDYQLVRALDLLHGLSLFGGKIVN